MNKTIKTILLVVGVILIAYGIYKVVSPEASVSIGDFGIEAQDNNDAYITIGLGVLALLGSLIAGKK
ncbi:hypothetical protein [Winogradskyella sp. A3E31]|uniref:hypothetical protein n=1 Tax=Winogradskyella sp. A3E31 TaxID=3349637 RepID=UPI00398A98BB